MNGLNLKLILEVVDKITSPVRAIKGKLVETFKAATKGAAELAEALNKAGKKASEVGGFLTRRLSLPILGVGALSLRSAGQIEELTMQMESLAGGADKARDFVKSLQGYIDKFGADELGRSVQQLETAGYSIDEIRKRLGFLGNVAAGSRVPLSELTEQYIELRKAGKASDGDLATMQKSNIPIVKELAKQLGKTEKQIWNMAASGKISFQQYRKAMEGLSAEGGRFEDAMDRQGKSINGIFKELRNSISGVMADLGTGLWKDLDIGPKIKAISSAIRGLVQAFMALPDWLKSSITWFVLIVAMIGPVVMIIGQLTVGIAGLLFAFGKLPLIIAAVSAGFRTLLLINTVGAAISNFIVALRAGYTVMQAFYLVLLANPFTIIIAAVVALGSAAYMLIKHWDSVKEFFSSLWEDIKAVFEIGVTALMEYLQPLIDAINTVIGGITQIGRGVGQRIGSAWNYVTGGETSSNESDSAAAGAGVSPAMARDRNTKVDAGGTIKISIDDNRKAQVIEARSNDSRMQYQAADTGQLMGGLK